MRGGKTVAAHGCVGRVVGHRHRDVARREPRRRTRAARRGVGLTITTYAKAAAVPMDPGLQEALSLGVARAGANPTPRRLPSGAGHDAMAMAALCPAALQRGAGPNVRRAF